MDKSKDSKDYYEVDLMQVLRAMGHRLWLILVVALIGGGIAFSVAAFAITPKYEADMSFYVNNSDVSIGGTSVSISNGDLVAAQSLVNTYIEFLKSRDFAKDILADTGYGDLYTPAQITSMIEAHALNGTEVFRVKVTGANTEEIEKIAQTIENDLPHWIESKYDGASVRTVDHSELNPNKVSPSITRYTLIGGLLGVLVACIVITIGVFRDTQIHSEDYLTKTYDVPVLAVIPDLLSSDGSNYSGYYKAYAKSEGGDQK